MRPRRPCLDCGEPCEGNRCPKHAMERAVAKASKNAARGLFSDHWRAVRRARLALDAGLCTFRLDGCTVYAATVHLDSALEGNHWHATVDNTRSACRHCHGVVDAPRSQEERRFRR
jgi:hypothetical protein